MRGSEFAASLVADISKREEQVLAAIRDGSAYIEWVPLDVSLGPHHATILVSADAFAIGDADDYFRPSLSATALQRAADLLGAMLPTSKISDLAHDGAAIHLEPMTRAPGPTMASTTWMKEQNAKLDAAIAGRRGLVSSVGKDWVLTPRLVGHPDRSANYGWHSSRATHFGPTGHRVFQPIGLAHDRWHVDYSQCGRLVLRTCVLNGAERDLGEVLRDPILHALFSDEGVVLLDRIPTGATEEEIAAADAARRLTPDPKTKVKPTLREGSTGEFVVEVQKIVGATADGIFGPGTKRKVQAWQTVNGLIADGIWGPKCWAASAVRPPAGEPTADPTPTPVTVPVEKIKFVQAKNYRAATARRVDLVVLHTMEAAEKPSTAEAVANWFASAGAPMASAHYCVDNDSIVQCVHEKDVAFAAPGANANGIQIEMAGYARQSAEDWADPFSETMLRRAARLVADICKGHDIPIEQVAVAGLTAKPQERGITTHAACSKAFKQSDHYDPGPNFPMADFLELVREFSIG